MTSRELVLKMLISLNRTGKYSNIALDTAFNGVSLDERDKRFAAALYYGVIERRITLDWIISTLSNRPVEKISERVIEILRMGLYQILYMDSVPDRAAVNESVKLASQSENRSAAGFVNALLRNFLRSECEIKKTGQRIKDLSIEYSLPEWIVSLWLRDYGQEHAEIMMAQTLTPAPLTARFNTFKFSVPEILRELESQNVAAEKIDSPARDAYILTGCGRIEELSAFKKGMFHIEDLSCQLCCEALGAKAGDIVLDVCSAPGGKAFTMAENTSDNARIYAYDIYSDRVNMIKSGAGRLGLKSIITDTIDARKYNEKIPMADRVLCDVPCSGLGVIRRKPEIKYRSETDIASLSKIQYEILKTSSQYLKPGGMLIYSTCTLRRAENEDIVERFLDESPDFEPVKLNGITSYSVTITPDIYSDGFFISKVRRKADI